MLVHTSERKQPARFIAALACVMVAVVACVLASSTLGAAAINPDEAFFDKSAQEGQAPNKTPEEQRAEMGRVVEEGTFCISIASAIVFAEPGEPGKAYIENVPNNPYDLTVDIALKDSGESVYTSKGIAPNSYIEDIHLKAMLEPGSYQAIATFSAYDRTKHVEQYQAKAEVTLILGKD